MDAVVLSSGDLVSAVISLELQKQNDIESLMLYVAVGEDTNNFINAMTNTALRLNVQADIYNTFYSYAQEDQRNKLLLLVMAAARYADTIYLGYTDKETIAILKDIEKLLRDMGSNITIETPLEGLTYSDIAERAELLIGEPWVIKATLHCDAQEKGAPTPCGLCPKCYEKYLTMLELGIDTSGYFDNDPQGESE